MGLLTESGGTTIAILVGIALVTGWLLLRSHRYLQRRKADDAVLVRTGRPQPKDSGHHLDADPSVLRWEVEMHEIARELSARLDSKMGALQALIAEADRAAARLEAATRNTAAANQPDGRPKGQ